MDSKLLELCRLPVGYPPYMVASIASIGHYSAGSKTAFADAFLQQTQTPRSSDDLRRQIRHDP